MNGNNMLGGIGGFMQGWRYGRELVEGDENDRKLRAAQLASEEAAAAESRKEQAKTDREAIKQQAKNEQFRITSEQTAARDASNNANAQANLAISAGRLGLDNTHYIEGAPMRAAQLTNEEWKNKEAQLRTEKAQTDDRFVADSRRDLEEFDQWTRGDSAMAPEHAARWDTMFGIAAQDPKPAMAALQKILPQSAELFKQGNLQGISQLWGSPEGKVAMEAWAPAYKTSIGKTVEGGRYTIQDVNPNRLEMANNGVAMILDVSIAPSKQFAEELTRQRAAAKTPEEIARIDRQLAPSTYQAPLTEGRVAISDGGKPRIFTQQEFAKGISNLQQRLAFHQQHPDQVDKIRRRLLARASGSGVSDALKAEASLDKELIIEQAKVEDQAMRAKGLDLQERGLNMRANGRDNPAVKLNQTLASIDRSTNMATRDTTVDGERQSVSRELLDFHSKVNTKARDLAMQDPTLSAEQAIQRAWDMVEMPQSEVDKKIAGIRASQTAPTPAAQGMSPTGNIDGMTRQVIGPNGERFSVVLRNGQWVRQ